MTSQRSITIFIILLTLFSGALVFTADSMSISFNEADIYFNQFNVLSFLIHLSTTLFGQNDIALKLPFIFFYIASSILIYLITKNYLKKESDRLVAVFIFMILPGVLSASLLVNTSIIVTFCILLYLYWYKTTGRQNYILLFLFLALDNSFAIFYLALFFYSLTKKDNKLLVFSLVLFGLSMYIYGFDTGGKPKGYFLDTVGIYASIFSPLLFFYFFYSVYRVGIKGKRSIYWYISFTALIFSLLFSMRQKIQIEDFAPYVVVAIPLMIKLFFSSFRVRLPEFRKKHIIVSSTVLVFLLFTSMSVFISKPIYLLLKKPQKHFAYKHHFAKEIAQILKANNISNIYSDDSRLLLRLRFYGIEEGRKNYITLSRPKSYDKELPIKYVDKKILTLFITHLK